MLTYLMDMSDMSTMLPLLLMPAKVAFSRYLALLLLPAPPVIHLLALGTCTGGRASTASVPQGEHKVLRVLESSREMPPRHK